MKRAPETLALLPGLVLCALAAPVPARSSVEPWLVANIQDHWVKGQSVQIQFPLTWLRDAHPIVLRGEGGAPDLHLNGPGLFDVGRSLEPGESREVGSQRSLWDETVVEVAAREPAEQPSAGKLRLRVETPGRLNDIDIALPLGLVERLEGILRVAWDNCARCRDRAEGVEQLTTNLGALSALPPFGIVRVQGGPTRIVLRTESE